jgi:hypothetical protein
MMKRLRFDPLIALLVLAACALILVAALKLAAQNPDPLTTDTTWNCLPAAGSNDSPLQLKISPSPFFAIAAVSGKGLNKADVIAPTIDKVIYSGGANVLNGNVKIPATTAGVPFTVTANDDIGIVAAHLYVDGLSGPQDGDASQFLPSTFYLRWNAKSVAPGIHNFRLVVWDGGGNSASQSWSMVR